MSDKSEAIGQVRGTFKELLLVVRDIPDERFSEIWFGEWSTKDILAHLASWDEFAAEDLHRVGRGHIPCLAAIKREELDRWNEFFTKLRKQWPLVQVRFESQHCHEQMMEALNALPESMFASGNAVANFCATSSAHYREHVQQIKSWYNLPLSYGRKEPDQWAGTNLSSS